VLAVYAPHFCTRQPLCQEFSQKKDKFITNKKKLNLISY
jgi:hypothetical protein